MRAPRKSLVLEKLRAGETVFSFKLNLNCSRPVEIAALSGYDCVWICNEHVPSDYSIMEKQILAAKAYGIDCMVRVPRGSYSDLIKPLEIDASGIMIPHIMSAEDARKIVWQTRFHPVGRRPVDGGNADGMFCMLPNDEYYKFANENRFVVIQIEDPEPMNELDAICSIDGIDMIFFGPGDFSQGIGTPGDFSNPKIAETRKLVAEAARRHGKFAGTVAAPATVEEYAGMGYQFLNIGADVIGLGNYCNELQAKLKSIKINKINSIY